jgi:hypothetical protein
MCSASKVALDHGRAPDRVRVIRATPDALTVDLDVSGVVRRYKGFLAYTDRGATLTWLRDVP